MNLIKIDYYLDQMRHGRSIQDLIQRLEHTSYFYDIIYSRKDKDSRRNPTTLRSISRKISLEIFLDIKNQLRFFLEEEETPWKYFVFNENSFSTEKMLKI